MTDPEFEAPSEPLHPGAGLDLPLLSLDIGFKRTGIALSESGMIAQPLRVVEAKMPHMTNVVEEILDTVKEYSVRTLIVGIPYGQDDEPSEQALKVEQILTRLEERLASLRPAPQVIRVNEYRSTQDAAQMYPGATRDAAAAALILQDYIDQHS